MYVREPDGVMVKSRPKAPRVGSRKRKVKLRAKTRAMFEESARWGRIGQRKGCVVNASGLCTSHWCHADRDDAWQQCGNADRDGRLWFQRHGRSLVTGLRSDLR